jgi:hypothetical protein
MPKNMEMRIGMLSIALPPWPKLVSPEHMPINSSNQINKWTAVVGKQKPVDIIPDNASSMYESAPKPASGIGYARETSDVMMRTVPSPKNGSHKDSMWPN